MLASNALAMLGALREVGNAELRMSRWCRVPHYQRTDPLSFAGLSVAKHSSEPNSDFGKDMERSGLQAGPVYEQGPGKPKIRKLKMSGLALAWLA